MNNPYQNALDIQDACNLLAVLGQFHRDMKMIADIERPDTDVSNTHPVVVMYLWKLSSLAHLEYDSSSSLIKAQDVCMEKAKEWEYRNKEDNES